MKTNISLVLCAMYFVEVGNHRYLQLLLFLVLNIVSLTVKFFLILCSAIHLHKLNVTSCFHQLLLTSLWPVKFSRHSFLIIHPRNVNCIFLILHKSHFHFHYALNKLLTRFGSCPLSLGA